MAKKKEFNLRDVGRRCRVTLERGCTISPQGITYDKTFECCGIIYDVDLNTTDRASVFYMTGNQLKVVNGCIDDENDPCGVEDVEFSQVKFCPKEGCKKGCPVFPFNASRTVCSK